MPLRAKISPSALPSLKLMSTASNPETESSDQVLFRTLGAVREVTLNRPKKLNAINENMLYLLKPRLLEYAKAPTAGIVLLKGAGGKALSAGGDVAFLAKLSRDEGSQECGRQAAKFFREEFSLNHYIATYPKPYVSIMDGIVMGGGVGLSAHGPFRIGTEKTLFAMPETTIGYYCDVGGLWFLSRLDGFLGLYLAMTSERLSGYDAYLHGVTSHFVASEKIPALEKRLQELIPQTATTDATENPEEYYKLVNSAIEDFTSTEPPADWKPAFTAQNLDTIDACFSKDTVPEILNALIVDGSEFALKTHKTLLERCPISLVVVAAAFKKFAKSGILDSFKLEENIVDHFMYGKTFPEGTLALLVDKRKPNWVPATVEEVPSNTVAKYFAPHEEKDLNGSIVFENEINFTEYPHNFGLPTENEIRSFVIGETSPLDTKATAKDVHKFFSRRYGTKSGLKTKIDSVLARKTKPDSTDPALLDWNY